MLKKEIKFKNLEGEEEVETFYFNLTEAEIVEMQMSVKGGLEDHLKSVVASEDGKEIIRVFKDLILTAYGEKSPDGKRFIKNEQLREEFASSPAYSAYFMEMVTDADAAVEFVNGIIPRDLQERANQMELSEKTGDQMADAWKAREQAGLNTDLGEKQEPRKLTPAEAVAMDHDELQSGLATGKYVLAKEDEIP